MAFAYSIKDQHAIYFLTLTVNEWADVFSRRKYADLIVESLRHCQKEKGLVLFGWVIMTNHVHLIAACSGVHRMSDFVRDFKKYTSKQIVKAIEENLQESRKRWLLNIFCHQNGITFWQADNHAVEIASKKFFDQKLNYLHQNPVRAGYVYNEQDWALSSAGTPMLLQVSTWYEQA
jgi:putative transposase